MNAAALNIATETNVDDRLNPSGIVASPELFRLAVIRHTPAVYAHCLRRLRDPGKAEDATQAVFVMLARRADRLPAGTVLAGWLHTAARYACLTALRGEARRQHHERRAAELRQEAHMPSHALPESMSSQSTDPMSADPTWAEFEPILDDALAELRTSDRDALVLRYLEHRPTRDVAQHLGVSESAAKQRVSRAVARLRKVLVGRRLNGLAAGVPVLLSVVPATTVPAGLIDAAARAAAGPASESVLAVTKGALHTMAQAKAKSIAMMAAYTVVGLVLLTGAVGAFLPPMSVGQRLADKIAGPPAQAAPVLVAAAPKAETPKPVNAPAALEGTWSCVVQGRPCKITFKGTRVTMVAPGENSPADIVLVDETSDPHKLDAIVRPESTVNDMPSDRVGNRMLLAYAIQPDGTMKLAFPAPGAPRPTKLEPGPDLIVAVLHREPAATKPSK